ncbi:S-layer homology domain-containing protein [Paenibacillus antarcticus]|uniref:Uncharacterized protein n=1 Tax=Paenibacillus antarcticus TaxID=253703 RepID=A0A168Q4I6_9BACL|nr:S-layer homology domain-containing protein [Paenibacillus antarcticus]OAB47378.1 hypothetical protein PBAT_06675 [Paenibacillus antarcticus]
MYNKIIFKKSPVLLMVISMFLGLIPGWNLSVEKAYANETNTYTQIDSGGYHTVALDSAGNVWTWGNNEEGQLGNGTQTQSNVPVKIEITEGGSPVTIVKVAGGAQHTVALDESGHVWTWGVNSKGQLGTGETSAPVLSPAKISGISDVQNIAAGAHHTIAIKTDNTVWVWGDDYYGSLGVELEGITHPMLNYSAGPVQVLNGGSPFTAKFISAGDNQTLAIMGDDTLWTWGRDGTTVEKLLPTKVTKADGSDLKAKVATGGNDFSVALATDGIAWTWGDNYSGRLGDGTEEDSDVPVQVVGLSGVTDIAAGYAHVVAIDSIGDVWTWGLNRFGQLGNKSDMNASVPVKVRNKDMSYFTGATTIAAGGTWIDSHTLAIKDGEIVSWGANGFGQLGDVTVGPYKNYAEDIGEDLYEVVFDSQGGSPVPSQTVESGATLTVPTPPTKEGYNFVGWYISVFEPDYVRDGGINNEPWDFGTSVDSNMTLYAEWLDSSIVETNFEGDLTTEQMFIRPLTPADNGVEGSDYDDVYSGDQLFPGDEERNYFIKKFVPSVTGEYTIEVIDDGGLDTFMLIYQGSFDPVQPLVNAIAANDDSDYEDSRIPDQSLTAGTDYYVIMTSYSNGETGHVKFKISGPGGVLVTDPGAAATPVIEPQPEDETVTEGETATFTVQATASDNGTLTYQWQESTDNGVSWNDLDGKTNASYTTEALVIADTGSKYRIVVTNTKGAGTATATSNVATLTVNEAAVGPTITTQPQNQTVIEGQTASFMIVAEGTSPLTYQWKKDGIDISEATAPMLTISKAQAADAGSYTVEVLNQVDSITSSVATLTVNKPGSVDLSLIPGDAHVNLSWNNVPETVTYSVYKDNSFIDTVSGSVNTYDVTGLTNGITYNFEVKALDNNEVVIGESGQISATPMTVPGVPTGIKATAGNGEATVRFTAPSDHGGSPITGYVVHSNPGNITAIGTGTTIQVTGLTNGTTYTFKVKAVNAVGDGQESSASNEVTPYRPSSGDGSGANISPTPPTPSVEIITVDVENGAKSSGDVVAKAVIQRTTMPDGRKKDAVNLTPEQASKAIKQLVEAGSDAAKIVIPDPKDEVAELNVTVPLSSIKTLKEGKVSLEINTNNVRIIIPNSSMEGLKDDVYFRLIPIKAEAERKEVEQRAKTEKIVREKAGNNNINVIGRPMTIETNLQSQKVTLVLPLGEVKLSKENLNNLGIFIEHSDGERELVKGEVIAYDASGKLGIRFTVNKFSTFTIVQMQGSQHKAYIKGYPNGTFGPNLKITRAEMAAIITRVFDKEEQQHSLSYMDVKASHWAKGSIDQVTRMGIMKGYPNGSFKPEQTISRAEMANIAFNLNTNNVVSGGGDFSDITNHWAELSISQVKAKGIIEGYEDGTFRPNQSLTRAEAVTIINKLLGRGPLFGAEMKWVDVPAQLWAYGNILEASLDHGFEKVENGEKPWVPTP